jgi:chemotaxis signal transduction protein
LISISQISDTASPKARRRERSEQHTDATALGEIIRERKRMLIFDAGVELSTPIRDVTSVHELPRHVTPWQKAIPGLLGLFQHETQMLPLFHLGAHLQGDCAGCEMPEAGRVLISGTGDQKLGFLIEKVTGIALSDWWSGPDSTLDGDLGTAHIQNWPQDRVLPRIRLAERAQSLLDRLSSR